MQQQNYKSTKKLVIPQQNDPDISPSQEKDNPLTHTIYANFVSTHTMCKTYSDQTGKFIIQSSRGNNYIFILYEYDSNFIFSIPIKNRQAKSIADACKICYIWLKKNGHVPDLHILGNKCSNLLKSSFSNTQHRFPTTTAPHSPSQRQRTGHTNLEKPLPLWTCHMRPRLPCDRMGPPHATVQPDKQPT